MNFFTSGRLFAFFFRFPLFSTRCFLLHQRLEARAGIEPAIKLLQSPALPLGYPASQRTRHLRVGACSFKFFQQKPDSQSIAAKSKRLAKRKVGAAVPSRPQLSQARSPHRLAKGKGTFLPPAHPPGAHAGTRMSPAPFCAWPSAMTVAIHPPQCYPWPAK